MSAPRLAPDSLAHAFDLSSRLVEAVLAGSALTQALAECWQAHPALAPGARGAVMDLTYGTLRDFGRGDFLLGSLLHKPLTDPAVRALLLVALYRLAQRPEQAYVIVDQAVRAAGLIQGGAVKGLINAVLRNFLRQHAALLRDADRDDIARHRHPGWWITRLRRDWPEHAEAILDAGNQHPPMSLRVNLRRATVEAVEAELSAAGMSAQISGEAGVRLAEAYPVSALPGFAQGRVSVQDLGAQRAAALLAAEDGMHVLDACAAPGGKTAHILERNAVTLLALDADASRAARIDDTLARLGLAATVQVADCRAFAKGWAGRAFDRILADVPCSASGVVRRHPDIKWLRRSDDIKRFAAQQAEIIDALWPLLAPGGVMLYATCSVFRAENQDQIAAFCARHPDAERWPIDGAPDLTLLPCSAHDGFYYARLKKRD